MGICASCLGLNRHPSQETDETDPLLDEPTTGYGAAGGDGQMDEEELQREREELDRITNAATENMIDVHHPEAAELGPNASMRSTPHQHTDAEREQGDSGDEDEDDEEDEEEAEWLRSVEADNKTQVQGMEASGLVLDMGQLRDEPSAAKKSLKARVGS